MMDNDNTPIYPNPLSNQIILQNDIFTDYLNYNNEQNFMTDEEFIKPNLEAFDKFFDEKHSRKSSSDTNECKKAYSHKSFNNTPKSEFNKQITKKDIINSFNNYNNNLQTKITKQQKKLFNSNLENINQNSSIIDRDREIQKEKKKRNNRVSARKSRIKRKLYIEQLEKDHIKLKKELEEIKSKNYLINNGATLTNPSTLNNANNNNDSSIFFNNDNLNGNIISINELKEEEDNIMKTKLHKDINIVNSFTAKQRIILEKLLLNQIEIMMPIKVKTFQNKYLKLAQFQKDDNINIIKNKINENIEAIAELYDVEEFDKNSEGNIKNGRDEIGNPDYMKRKTKSMGYQIYIFYKNLKNYVNEFEKIYLALI